MLKHESNEAVDITVAIEQDIEAAMAQLACVLEARLSPYEQVQFHKGMSTLNSCLNQIREARSAKQFSQNRSRVSKAS